MRIVVSLFTCHLFANEYRPFKGLVTIGKFNFGQYQTLVVAVELIDLECVVSAFYKITGLVYYASVAQSDEFPGVTCRNLLFPFITA